MRLVKDYANCLRNDENYSIVGKYTYNENSYEYVDINGLYVRKDTFIRNEHYYHL